MATIGLQVKIDLSGLKRFQGFLDAGLRGTAGPIRDAVRQWGARYRGAMQERMSIFSRGGGDWPPLKPATIARRIDVGKASKRVGKARQALRRARLARIKAGSTKYRTAERALLRAQQAESRVWKAAARLNRATRRREAITGQVAMLIDTGTLFASLNKTFTNAPGQLQLDIPYGIEVGFGGPAKYPKGRATIADIASFHQFGTETMRARSMIAEPPPKTKQLMAGDMGRALQRAIKQTEIR
ncbi:MAG TPA: hypothetical protein VM431_15180 [Phycisphaerae bacterium]|nr:hypothetical protein [Phycisphaerae bacterium]